MGRAILIIGAAALAVGVIVYSLIECARTDSAEMRGLRKGGWLAVILLLPLLGALLWLFLGRPKGSADTARPTRGRGPDDDPQFLRNLEQRRRQQEQAERLRRWEEQLKRRGSGSSAAGGAGQAPDERPGGDPDEDLAGDPGERPGEDFNRKFEEEFGREFGEDPGEGPAGTSGTNRPPRS